MALAGLGWLYLSLAIAASAEDGRLGALGPGMALLERLTGAGKTAPAWLQILCAAPLEANTSIGFTAVGFAVLLAMWVAMALAMMLPTAAPMLLTYAELADTAARQRQPAVSPLFLASGYLTVWLGFATGATALTAALQAGGWMEASMAPIGGWLAAAIFAGGGLYQFSPLKAACLKACQSPFRFFFANWTDRPVGVFRLGLRQGLFCLGCCWAAMLVMFAVGLMNVTWMAGLGIVMTIEKMVAGEWVRRGIGVVLLCVSAILAWREVGLPLP